MSKLDCAIPTIELESHKHVIYRESPFSTIKIERETTKSKQKCTTNDEIKKSFGFDHTVAKVSFSKNFRISEVEDYFIFVSQVFNHIPSSAEKCRAASFKNRDHS